MILSSTYPLRLETPRLLLRELRLDDWPAARAIDADPEVVRFQSNDVVDEAGSRAYLEQAERAARESPRQVYDLAITEKGDDLLLGRVGLRIRRPEHREAELWFTLRRDRWGAGLAREAAAGLLDLAFGPLGLHRVYGDCDPRNHRSARLMEQLGLQREAHLRQNWWLKGEWCDSLLFAILEEEWRPGRL